jgi:hypothetical protein
MLYLCAVVCLKNNAMKTCGRTEKILQAFLIQSETVWSVSCSRCLIVRECPRRKSVVWLSSGSVRWWHVRNFPWINKWTCSRVNGDLPEKINMCRQLGVSQITKNLAWKMYWPWEKFVLAASRVRCEQTYPDNRVAHIGTKSLNLGGSEVIIKTYTIQYFLGRRSARGQLI